MKKKLIEWRGEFTSKQYKKLETLLSEAEREETYELSELNDLLGDETKNQTSGEWSTWLKGKWKWAKDNWILLIMGIVLVSFVIYLLKKIWVYIFKE